MLLMHLSKAHNVGLILAPYNRTNSSSLRVLLSNCVNYWYENMVHASFCLSSCVSLHEISVFILRFLLFYILKALVLYWNWFQLLYNIKWLL